MYISFAGLILVFVYQKNLLLPNEASKAIWDTYKKNI